MSAGMTLGKAAKADRRGIRRGEQRPENVQDNPQNYL